MISVVCLMILMTMMFMMDGGLDEFDRRDDQDGFDDCAAQYGLCR
jgi:hypothetical protein